MRYISDHYPCNRALANSGKRIGKSRGLLHLCEQLSSASGGLRSLDPALAASSNHLRCGAHDRLAVGCSSPVANGIDRPHNRLAAENLTGTENPMHRWGKITRTLKIGSNSGNCKLQKPLEEALGLD